jgi:hypothetical protein
MFQSINEISFIITPITPIKATSPVILTFLKFSNISVTVTVFDASMSMFLIIYPLSFISVSIIMHINPLSFYLRVFPLPNIAVPLSISPLSFPLLGPHVPLPFILFPVISPRIHSIPMRLSLVIASFISVPVSIPLITSPLSEIVSPVALKQPATFVPHETLAMSHSVFHLT